MTPKSRSTSRDTLQPTHNEILSEQQGKLVPLLSLFSKTFGLVGGTAIALYIGHRQSIDFDLFSIEEFDTLKVRKVLRKRTPFDRVLRDERGHYTVVLKGVSCTFFYYPFPISFSHRFEGLRLADLLTLAAMKAYALGRRPKWKDYVDLYFILDRFHGITEVIAKAKEIFGSEFSEKMFRVQLGYFDDIDFSENVIFLKGFKVPVATIRKALLAHSVRDA